MAGKHEFIMTGVFGLDLLLRTMERKVRNRVARAALSKGAQVVAKAIKREVPSRHKNVRKAFGWRIRKEKRTEDRFTQARVGTVGSRKASLNRKKSQGKKSGVGISKQNVHWYILGTKTRRHKSGKLVGQMPSRMSIVPNGVKKSKSEMKRAMYGAAKKKMVTEMRKYVKGRFGK